MNFIKLPRKQYEYSPIGRYKYDYDNQRFIGFNSKKITVNYDKLLRPIAVNYKLGTLTKLKDNSLYRQVPTSVIYDINLNTENDIQDGQVYFYSPIAFSSNFNRVLSDFVPHKDIFLFYKEAIYFFNNSKKLYDNEQLLLLFKKYIYSEDSKFKIIEKEIQYYEKHKKSSQDSEPRRDPIPEDVRFEVWRRDQGRCVECGSKEKLEFDHIIPFSKGGSNSVRNIQLLCERCNRAKSNKI